MKIMDTLLLKIAADALIVSNMAHLIVNMGKHSRSVEELLFVNMGDNAQHARIVEALLFVNMGEYARNLRSVEALLFVNMGDNAQHARSVEALLFGVCGGGAKARNKFLKTLWS